MAPVVGVRTCWAGGEGHQHTFSDVHMSLGAPFSALFAPGQDLGQIVVRLQFLSLFHSLTLGFPCASSEDSPLPPPVVGSTEQVSTDSVPCYRPFAIS